MISDILGSMEYLELREMRQRHKLTAAQVAFASGTALTNVCAYERGEKTPSTVTLERLVLAIKAGADSPVYRHTLLTVPAAARELRKAVKSGASIASQVRIARELVANSEFIFSDADKGAFFAPPSTTGDRRWDVLLAGVAEQLASRMNVPIPQWAPDKKLPSFWYVSNIAGMNDYLFAHSPTEMKTRGVLVDPADLVPV